jgi:hypothetical protein
MKDEKKGNEPIRILSFSVRLQRFETHKNGIIHDDAELVL